MTERKTYGTADPDAPATRAELERALRHLNLSDLELRDTMLQLAAHLVALTDEVTRRIDRVEPEPAAANTPAQPAQGTVEASVNAAMNNTLRRIRAADSRNATRVSLDLSGVDKYAVEGFSPPCDELIHLCKARCCKLSFPLSTADLDEGVISWDYGQPYLIRQRASDGYCVHNDPATQGCTVHPQRPRVCRVYDCREDDRIWIDYDQRIPAPESRGVFDDKLDGGSNFDLVARMRARVAAITEEKIALSESTGDAEPRLGPAPRPGHRNRPP